MIEQARGLGFRAVKIEPLDDCTPTNRNIVELAQAAREAAGDGLELLVDVGHRWQTAKEALRVLHELEEYDIGMIETPLWLDDIDGYREVSDRSAVPNTSPSARRCTPPSCRPSPGASRTARA